ncbi:SelB C-terminal domain-containing protein, partial [Pseudomonas aeruginosa]|nr:SelB C-terminal domain-containing protein [Pseudomonas aeruginosa]
ARAVAAPPPSGSLGRGGRRGAPRGPAALGAGQFRDRLGIGRKRSIQILEHFDRIGLTRRIGNDRRLREGSALAEQLLGGVSP